MKAGNWIARFLVLILMICILPVGRAEDATRDMTPHATSQAGDSVFFGVYPQTADGTDSTPIEWLVLENDGESVLLISRYALDCQPFHDKYINITWAKCSLRAWLNDDFYHQAFQPEEQQRILQTDVPADKNPSHSTSPGTATTDCVFLLSIPEANQYFTDSAARACVPTDYARQQGALTSDVNKTEDRMNGWFWLRSPGHHGNYASLVGSAGIINDGGCRVNGDFIGVRPCMRVRLF